MADDEIEAVWVKDTQGKMRGLHASCAKWMQLEPEENDGRKPYHTELCLGCGRFLDAVPPEREGVAPFNARETLL
jgi:hypothetical protein